MTYTTYISAKAFDEMEPGICDAVRNQERGTPDPTDPVYLKLHQADLAKQWSRRGLKVELNAAELRELYERFDYYVMCWKDSYHESPKEYLGLMSCGRAIMAQARKGLEVLKAS